MLIDKPFFVKNFVGTYKMEKVPEWDCTMIVSEEFNHADIKAGEKPLHKKQIFEFGTGGNDYIFLQLANVDITKDESILEFCNKNGLPCSSQVCFDDETGLNEDVEGDLATRLSKQEETKYARKDTMDRLEFCRCAVQIRNLMELKEILDRKTITDLTKFISLLIYTLLYSRRFIYTYDYNEDTCWGEHPEVLPKTRLMRFQYFFNFFCKRNSKIIESFPPASQLAVFIQRYKYQIAHPANIGHSVNIEDSNLISYMCSKENLNLLEVLERLFPIDPDNKTGIFFPMSHPVLHNYPGKENTSAYIQPFSEIPHTKNQFRVDEYGRITFDNKVEYSGDVLKELKPLALQALRDIITEGLARVSPRMIIEDGKLRGIWDLKQPLEGIYLELFSQLAIDAQYRLCENPTCGNFFSVSISHSNKRFCSQACASSVRQRRRRSQSQPKASTSKSEGQPT